LHLLLLLLLLLGWTLSQLMQLRLASVPLLLQLLQLLMALSGCCLLCENGYETINYTVYAQLRVLVCAD